MNPAKRSLIFDRKILIAALSAAVLSSLFLVSAVMAATSSRELADNVSREQESLAQKRAQIADLDSRIATADQYLNQRRTELADATSRLQEAEDRYNATLRLYEGRISAIYKMGDDNYYAVVMASDDFSDALARFSYLSKVSENDERLVTRVRLEAESVRSMHSQVDSLKQSQAEDVNTLKLEKQKLESQVTSEKSSIDSQLAALAQVRAKEQEDEARQAAEDSGYDGGINTGYFSPSFSVSNQPPAGMQPTGMTLSGVASWYGPGFQGNTTANGEIYNMNAFTAAHKSLPFNTWLKVTHDGRSVFVRINDRGPYVGGRIIDLSFASAQAIGISGIGYVSAEIYR